MFDGVNKKQQQIQAVDVEFEDVTVTPRSANDKQAAQKKSVLFQQLNKIAASTGTPISTASSLLSGEQKTSYSYDFDSNILLNCKVENWGRGVSIFADFLRDAKKFYKKTCLSAKYIYFFSYRPTYKEMSHEQLCWYLYWRASIRDGNYIKTGLTYIFLYLYEQINLCDVIGVEKVYKNIINIWKNYRQEFPRIDKYIAEWLIDFSLIHKIKINLEEIENILPALLNLVSLPEIYLQDDYFKNEHYTEPLIRNISAYDYKKSKFYTANNDVFDLHIPKIVFAVLSSPEFSEIFNDEIQNGVKIKATRESYSGAICAYENKWKITVEYKNAYKNFFFKQCLTDIIRFAENILREYLNVKSKLPIASFPDKLVHLLEEYQEIHLPSSKQKTKAKKIKKAEENPDIEIQTTEFNANIEMASEIEKESWDTTVTLVELQERDSNEQKPAAQGAEDKDKFNMMFAIDTNDTSFEDYGDMAEIAENDVTAEIDVKEKETEEIEEVIEFDQEEIPADENKINENVNNEIGEFIDSLNETEYKALSSLIINKQDTPFDVLCAEFLTKSGVMLESVIDEINGKAMDYIGDIVFDLSGCEFIEEYKQDLLFFVREK